MALLSEEQAAIRDMTRDFVRREIAPFAAEWDRTETVPLDTVYRIGALGLFGVTMPAEWGGSGADFLSYVLAVEELAYGDAGVCNMVCATNSYGFKVRDYGTDEQKKAFLTPVASGKEIGCMLLTEPQAGSDAGNLRTRAVRHGDRYVINGMKTLITSGRSAKVAVVLAVTDPDAGKRGISAFLVRTEWPGYKVLRVERKLGHRTNDTCQIALENLEVPAENMLGRPDEGLKIALSGLDSGRVAVAAQGIGVAQSDPAAREWYRRAADQGVPEAASAYGFMLANGVGGPAVPSTAIGYLRRGALAGDIAADEQLAFMYATGTGVARNWNEAVTRYRDMAIRGNARAQYNLANLLMDPPVGTPDELFGRASRAVTTGRALVR